MFNCYMKRNILFISSRADISGGSYLMLCIVKNISKLKEFKVFCAIPRKCDLTDQFIANSSSVNFIPFRKISFKSLQHLITFCKKNKIRIIHSHGRGAGYYSRLLKPFGFKVIHTLHGCHIPRGFLDRVKVTLDRILLPFTDIFICVSESELQQAKNLRLIQPEKTRLITNGIDINHFKKFNQSPKEKEIILGALTSLTEHKGNDRLIHLFNALIKKRENYKLYIAGAGPQENKLTNLIHNLNLEEKVFLLGQTTPETFFPKINILVSASKSEGMPLSVLEALAAGKSCVLSKVPGHIGLIGDEYLFDLKDSNEFISKVVSSHYPNNFDIEEYDKKIMVQKHIELYKEVINET